MSKQTANWNRQHFRQTAPIDLAGCQFTPIGKLTSAHFKGTYDGGGFTIEGLFIRESTTYAGLFHDTNETAVFKNMGLLDVDIVTTATSAGALAGRMVGSAGQVLNSYSTGSVSGKDRVGGLVGDLWANPLISNSYSSASVTITQENGAGGGLAGIVTTSGRVSNVYARGEVRLAAGINSTSIGGLVGGLTAPTETAAFFDSDVAPLSSVYGTGRTTAEMTSFATFSAWGIVDGWEAFNFTTPTSYWGICSVENSGYPFLLWEFSAEDDPCVAPVSGDSGNSGESQSTAAVTVSPTPIPTATTPQRVVPRAPAIPPLILTGPVFRAGVTPVAPETPSAFIGGVPAVLQKTVPDSTRLSLATGSVALDMTVASGSGARSTDGVTQLGVKNRSSIDLAGSGLLPGSTVQVFIPLTAEDSREVAQLVVNPDGTFSGAAALSTDRLAAPLPIGPRLLQLVTIDEDGNQIVLEMTVVIEQADPDPEINRELGDIPNMTPGSLEATSAGLPVDVSITALADQKLAVVEGDGWVMAIAIAPNAADGAVEETPSGATLKLVRDETALVSGSGFMAGTRADVWLFSEPTLVGTALIDANGEFTGEVSIDPNLIPAGEHTLQLQGVGTDGYVKAANLGVLVEEAASGIPAPDAGGFPWSFLWWILAGIVALGVLWFGLRRRRSSSHV
jgi:hypothetical protein